MLNERGYRKDRHIWRRPINGLTHMVQLQSSAWAIEDRGSFTFNLAVHWPNAYDASGDGSDPRPPKMENCFFLHRIGHLMHPSQDYWWNVNKQSDLDEIGVEAVEALDNCGLSRLAMFDSFDAVHDYLIAPDAWNKHISNVRRLLVLKAMLRQFQEFHVIRKQAEEWNPATRAATDKLIQALVSEYGIPMDSGADKP